MTINRQSTTISSVQRKHPMATAKHTLRLILKIGVGRVRATSRLAILVKEQGAKRSLSRQPCSPFIP